MNPLQSSPALPRRSSSPDESPTQSNSFHQASSARKRRRTSGFEPEAQPVSLVDVSSAKSRAPLSGTPDASSAGLAPSVMSPTTPDQQPPNSKCRLVETPSSQMTLNLRRMRSQDPPSPLADSPTKMQPLVAEAPYDEARFDSDLQQALQESLESDRQDSGRCSNMSVTRHEVPGEDQFEADLQQALQDSLGSDQHDSPKSSDLSSSRPHGPDGSERDTMGTSSDSFDPRLAFSDLVAEFPFTQIGLSPAESVLKVSNFFGTQNQVSLVEVNALACWFDRVATAIRDRAASPSVLALPQHNAFWLAVPKMILAMALKDGNPIPEPPALRDVALTIYNAFTHLTAWFISYDYETLKEASSGPQPSKKIAPELFSPSYLQQFHNLMRYRDPKLHDMVGLEADAANPSDDDYSRLAWNLQEQINRQRPLGDFILALINASDTWPRIANTLAPACQTATDFLREAYRRRCSGGPLEALHKEAAGAHKLWGSVSRSFDHLLDQHANCMDADRIFWQIQAMYEWLTLCLEGAHEEVLASLREHRCKYPSLPPQYTAEAVAWRWRLSAVEKLIRSTQIQHRLAAASTMSRSLYLMWDRFSNQTIGSSLHPFLCHLADTIAESSLIDYIIGPSCHPQIISESSHILGYLVITGRHGEQLIDRIWRGMTSIQDPGVADALSRMLSSVLNTFDYPGLMAILDRLRILPLEGFVPRIRAFWDQLAKCILFKCQNDRHSLTHEPVDLCLRLLREATVRQANGAMTRHDIHGDTQQILQAFLNQVIDAEGRERLYDLCLEDMASPSPTTLGSLWAMFLAIRPGFAAELRMLVRNRNLVRLVVGELEFAVGHARLEGPPHLLCWGPSQPRRDLIRHIISLQPDAIDHATGSKLWSLLVGRLALSNADRIVGWEIVNAVACEPLPEDTRNAFLEECMNTHIPDLSSEYFFEGALQFISRDAMRRVDMDEGLALDNQGAVDRSSIQQLWRVILEARDSQLATAAIKILAVDVYLVSRAIRACALSRGRQIHSVLVNRCLSQMKEASRKIRASDSERSNTERSLAAEEETQERRSVVRTLQLLRCFLGEYLRQPQLAAPDLKSLSPCTPGEMEGEPTELKYQCFNGGVRTDVKSLMIGRLNTGGSLLARLRNETGFDSYRIFYRGQSFQPSEEDVCKSLDQLRIREGLILVVRDEKPSPAPAPSLPGLSFLEEAILGHFDELWGYLGLDEELAEQAYHLVAKLPIKGIPMEKDFVDLHDDRFLQNSNVLSRVQPFKALYITDAIVQFTKNSRRARTAPESNAVSPSPNSFVVGLKNSMSAIVQVLSEYQSFVGISEPLRLRLSRAFIEALRQILCALDAYGITPANGDIAVPPASLMVQRLSNALCVDNEDGLAISEATFSVILQLGRQDRQFWTNLTADPAFNDAIRKVLLFDPRSKTRSMAVHSIQSSALSEQPNDNLMPLSAGEAGLYRLATYFWPVCLELIPLSVATPNQCHELFSLCYFLARKMVENNVAGLDLRLLATKTRQLLVNHVSSETLEDLSRHDDVAQGLATLMNYSLSRESNSQPFDESPSGLASELYQRHLFPQRPSEAMETSFMQRAVLNSNTRSHIYAAISSLVKCDEEALYHIIESLKDLVPFDAQDEDNPYVYELPYGFDRSQSLRSACGYVGLVNLSNTCYLNSLFTQLYMNVDFRSFISNAEIEDASSQKLLVSTQNLFGFMQHSFNRSIDTTEVVRSILTYEGTPIDVYIQMDVEEFYSLLFDRWESQLIGDDARKGLRSFYAGKLVQQVKSKECAHVSERLEPFSAIQCDVKGKASLEDSLQAYVDGELLEGDNKYKCSTCDTHVEAVKRACFEDLPDHLIFHLKRFDFDLRTLERCKINDYFTFPHEIDMYPYTVQGLSGDESADTQDLFELVGVLVHSGTAEIGHYYSFIRERPSTSVPPAWMQFNDDSVTPWDPNRMAYATFGGTEQDNSGRLYEKSNSAYMLFFQRASSLQAGEKARVESQAPTPLHVNIGQSLRGQIFEENALLLRRYCLFDPVHVDFVIKCFSLAHKLDKGSSPPKHELASLAMNMLLNHTDQVFTRAKEMPGFVSTRTVIQEAVQSCAQCAMQVHGYMCARPAVFRGLVQRNPDSAVRQFGREIFIGSMAKIFKKPLDLGESRLDVSDNVGHDIEAKSSIIQSSMEVIAYLWRHFHVSLQAWNDFFGLMLDFAKMGRYQTSCLLAEDYLLKLLRIVMADETLPMPAYYYKMLNNMNRRLATRPISYGSLLSTIDYLMSQLDPNLGVDTIVDRPSDRLEEEDEETFSWTSKEVELVHLTGEGRPTSLFVQKLLAVDQAPEITEKIVQRLVRSSQELDQRVLNTLCLSIRAEVVTQPMDPFLRAASWYLDSTRHVRRAEELVKHVCGQARRMQDTEMWHFFGFLRKALRVERKDKKLSDSVQQCTMRCTADWAPFVLAYHDLQVGREADRLLDQELFRRTVSLRGVEESRSREILDQVAERLGRLCLVYIDENHIQHGRRIRREHAALLLCTVGKCITHLEAAPNLDHGVAAELAGLQRRVAEHLNGLVVDDEMELGLSEWDGSNSSDRMDDIAEIDTQAMRSMR